VIARENKPVLNAQSSVSGLEAYTEYFLGAAALLFVLPFYQTMTRKRQHVAHKPVMPVVAPRPVPLPPPIFKRKMTPPNPLAIPATLPATKKYQPVHTGVTVFSKSSKRKTMTQDIREALAARRQAREAKKAVALLPQHALTPVPRRHFTSVVISATPPVQPVKRIALPERESSAPAEAAVIAAAHTLAAFANKYCGEPEAKLDNRAERVRDLLALYYLHRYNLSAMQLMKAHPGFKTAAYFTVMTPLRLEFAHFSSAMTSDLLLADVHALQAILRDFENGVLSLPLFMREMNALLDQSHVMQQRRCRLQPLENKVTKRQSARESVQAAVTAYTHFVEQTLPEMRWFVSKLGIETPEVDPAEPFSKTEYRQALSHLLVMSYDNLPVHLLMRLKAKPEIYASDTYRFVVTMRRTLRNQLAHREPLSDAQMAQFCEALVALTAYQDKSTACRERRGVVSTLFGLPSPEGVTLAQEKTPLPSRPAP
jgi:hypothetical protein